MITPLTYAELPSFFPVFSSVLSNEFPSYSKKTVRYLLEEMYTPTNFTYWLKNRLKTIFVAKNEAQTIIGFAVIDEPYGGVSLCRWLGVVKEYQKMGVGSALVEMWIEQAIKTRCHKVELAAQPTAREFYEKAGLTLEGLRKKSYFGIDQYVFGKVVADPQANKLLN